MKKYSQILLFLFLILCSCKGDKKDDKVLAINSSEDSLSIYFSLANDINLPFHYKQKYNQRAFDIIKDQKDDSLKKVNLFKLPIAITI